MTKQVIKISVRVGLFTAAVIILYEASDLLLIYKYFRFDYYLSVAALVALIAGILIAKANFSDVAPKSLNNPLDKLTNKEIQILMLITEGKTNKEIALQNFVEVSTVKTHINNIYTKMDISNRKQAAEIYRQYRSTINPPFLHPQQFDSSGL